MTYDFIKESGIKIFFSCVNIINRVDYSSGTVFVSNNNLGKQPLIRDSDSQYTNIKLPFEGFIPKEPWFPLVKDQEIFTNKLPENFNEYVRISRIPSQLFERIKNVGNVNNIKLASVIFKNEIGDIETYFTQFLTNSKGLVSLGLRFLDFTNTPTLTIDQSLQKFIGLHIDDWENDISIENKLQSNKRNRICINLGVKHRYFYFVSLTLKQIVNKISNVTTCVNKINQIPTQFFELNPNYPVIRIKLLPGEYYVAPTENIIHDGANFNRSLDITMTILGNFW